MHLFVLTGSKVERRGGGRGIYKIKDISLCSSVICISLSAHSNFYFIPLLRVVKEICFIYSRQNPPLGATLSNLVKSKKLLIIEKD